MSQDIRAIFDKGVFRPLEPLEFQEGAYVNLHIEELDKEMVAGEHDESAELKRQLDALRAMFAQVDEIPQTPHGDGLTGRDHDQILYGTKK